MIWALPGARSCGLAEQVLVGRDARLALGLAGARALPDPLELALQRALAGLLLTLLLGQTLLLLLEPGRVVALPGDAVAAIELEDPAGDVVEEVAIVGDRHHGALVVLQEALEPGDRFGVQMVGRLVEQQEVGLLQQQPAERDPPPLAAGERGHVLIARRAAQRVHRDLERALQLPAVRGVDLLLQLGLLGHQRVHVGIGVGEFGRDLVEAVEQRLGRGDALHDVAEHVLLRIELRLLRQEADLGALGRPGLAGEILVEAGHDAQERRLAGAVDAEHADLGAGQERQRDVRPGPSCRQERSWSGAASRRCTDRRPWQSARGRPSAGCSRPGGPIKARSTTSALATASGRELLQAPERIASQRRP